MIRERFAPSPTGLLHLGHAYSALLAWDAACASGGEFLLRMENTDITRCKPEFETAIYRDLNWLGISWPEPVLRQTDRSHQYNDALARLIDLGLCYPCKCTRSDIKNAQSAPQEGAENVMGPDGSIYPKTCTNRPMSDQQPSDAIRLNMHKALSIIKTDLWYTEIGTGNMQTIEIKPDTLISECGDIVLARKDIDTTGYHLSVVIDDAFQSITHITRGRDLIPATPIHCLLQTLLGLPTPIYNHHRLIRDENGKRLAKRYDAMAVGKYRADGATAADIRAMVDL